MDKDKIIDAITNRILQELGLDDDRHNFHDAHGISIAISARHVHITREVFEQIYGSGRDLTAYTMLYQPGEFAAAEVITLVGPRLRAIQDVRILGPFRKATQIELSRTDGVLLGIEPPVRRSGDLAGSEPIVLVGPAGSISLKEGAICANRHIHISPEDARRFNVKDNDIVKIRIPGIRALTFENVQIRVNENYLLQMHLDTDDANAAGIRSGDLGELIKD